MASIPWIPTDRGHRAPVHWLRRRSIRVQVGHRPATQTLRHALDRRRSRRHHHAALPAGQPPRRPDLDCTAQPDASRLTSPPRQTILIPYKNDAHTPGGGAGQNVGGWRHYGGMAVQPPVSSAEALDGFSPATRAWFEGAFAVPTQAQAQAWRAIGKGEDTLVIAPTGSGKTLAAFLWAIDRLAAVPPPADPKQRCRVLYVSPLKALAVDIERNLRSPLTGIRHAAHRLGLPEPDIAVAVRTGDTAADERRKLAAKPPDILITTPESLFLLLTSQARETLREVETVIVDEVHAVAGNKRGAHLALSLERLDALRGGAQRAQRIGLSATVRPPEDVAAFLGGARPVTVVQPASAKRIELEVVVPVEDMTDLETAQGLATADDGDDPVRRQSIWPHVEERVLDLIE